MYKVFVNDALIIVTDSQKNKDNFPVFLFKDFLIDELLHRIKSESIKGIILFCEDLEKDWKTFKKSIKVITAGGGLVVNSTNKILFIYRNGIWDLPKGRAEKDESIQETAVREVEEECGIENLTLQKLLIITYHVFYQKGKLRMKETHWYLMKSIYHGKLTPQLEEGITEAVFKNENQIKIALEDTYANIKLVLNAYQKTSS